MGLPKHISEKIEDNNSITLYFFLWSNLFYEDKTEKCFQKRYFFITRSPEQWNNESFIEEKVRETKVCEVCLRVFDDIMVYNQTAIDPFFTRV